MNEKYYTVITAETYAELVDAVNDLMEKDTTWKPVGGMTAKGLIYYQTMYRNPGAVYSQICAKTQPEYGRMTPRDAAIEAALVRAAWEALPEDQK